MGLLDSFRKRRERKQLKTWLQKTRPYIFVMLAGEVRWVHWEMLPSMEEIGVLPTPSGLPVVMTEEECAAVNGGKLPPYWGQMPYAWRMEAQKQAFHAKRPELFNRERKVASERTAYPTPEQIAEFLEANRNGGAEAIAKLLREKQAQKAHEPKGQQQTKSLREQANWSSTPVPPPAQSDKCKDEVEADDDGEFDRISPPELINGALSATRRDVDSPKNLYEIDMQTMSGEFLECWKAAGIHLSKQVDGELGWLRADPRPPFVEHLSFRLGNQLFFVRVEDIDGKVRGPGSLLGLLSIAEKANGRACILPMKKPVGEGWMSDLNDWGLLDAETRRPINPAMLVSEEKIEMTPWEVHNMAVQVVRDYIQNQGFQLMSWDGN